MHLLSKRRRGMQAKETEGAIGKVDELFPVQFPAELRRVDGMVVTTALLFRFQVLASKAADLQGLKNHF